MEMKMTMTKMLVTQNIGIHLTKTLMQNLKTKQISSKRRSPRKRRRAKRIRKREIKRIKRRTLRKVVGLIKQKVLLNLFSDKCIRNRLIFYRFKH